MITAKIRVSSRTWYSRGITIRTNNDQCNPLPFPGFSCANDSARNVSVRLLNVSLRLLGIFGDSLNRDFLLLNKSGNFLRQLAEFEHIPLDLANGRGTLQSRLSGIIGLLGAGTGDLKKKNVKR